jgi:hypothetical protein
MRKLSMVWLGCALLLRAVIGVLPDFKIRRALPLNQPVVVSFTPTKEAHSHSSVE